MKRVSSVLLQRYVSIDNIETDVDVDKVISNLCIRQSAQ